MSQINVKPLLEVMQQDLESTWQNNALLDSYKNKGKENEGAWGGAVQSKLFTDRFQLEPMRKSFHKSCQDKALSSSEIYNRNLDSSYYKKNLSSINFINFEMFPTNHFNKENQMAGLKSICEKSVINDYSYCGAGHNNRTPQRVNFNNYNENLSGGYNQGTQMASKENYEACKLFAGNDEGVLFGLNPNNQNYYKSQEAPPTTLGVPLSTGQAWESFEGHAAKDQIGYNQGSKGFLNNYEPYSEKHETSRCLQTSNFNIKPQGGPAYSCMMKTKGFIRFPLYENEGITSKPLLDRSAALQYQERSAPKPFSKKPKTIPAPPKIFQSPNLDSLEIDPNALGSPNDIYKSNQMLRINQLICKMSVFLNDIVPSRFTSPTYNEFTDTLNPSRFMFFQNGSNFKSRLKDIVHKCHMFALNLDKKLNANKLLDRKLYIECGKSIKNLYRLIAELDQLKAYKFQYNQDKFINQSSSERGRHLELLLEEICESIRECNIFVNVFEWTMDQKRKELGLNQLSSFDNLASQSSPQLIKRNISAESSTLSDFLDVNISNNLLASEQLVENEKYNMEFKKYDKLKNFFENNEIENNLDGATINVFKNNTKFFDNAEESDEEN